MAKTLLAKNLKSLRHIKRINQEVLAKGVGVPRNRIASYETQNIEPKLDLLAKIAAYFDLSIDALLTVPITHENYESIRKMRSTVEKTKAISVQALMVDLATNQDQEDVAQYAKRQQQIEKAFDGIVAMHSLQENKDGWGVYHKQLEFLIRQLLKQNVELIRTIYRINSTNTINKST